MNLKAIVTDMDGTLLNSNSQIEKETREALIECQKKGIKLILASGRNYWRIQPYLDELEMEKYGGLLIEINGIGIYDVQKKERNILRQLSKEEVDSIFSYLMTLNAESMAIYDEGLFDYMPKHILDMKKELRKTMDLPEDYPWTAGSWSWFGDMRQGYPNQYYIKDVSEIDQPINKFQVLQEEAILDEIEKDLREKYQGQLEIFRSTQRQIELGPFGYTKGDTLLRIMNENNLTRDEVAIFGDGGNDISMLTKSDYSFAMGQAADSVKEKAAYVTTTNDEQGILHALKELKVIE